jgi:hypothetical protein
MKTKLLLLLLGFTVMASAQTTINYTQDLTVFPNPDRGFFKFAPDVTSATTATLDVATLQNYRLQENVTLVYRGYYLEEFLTTDISAAYLAKIQADLDAVRVAGIKMIIRFAYTHEYSGDATKERMLLHIAQLGPILTENADVISVIHVGFIGAYGEWYYTGAEFGGFGYLVAPAALTATNFANRKAVVDALLANTTSQLAIRAVLYKNAMYGNTALTATTAFNGSAQARVGYHDDAVNEPNGGTYQTDAEYDFVKQETAFVSNGGETYDAVTEHNSCVPVVQYFEQSHFSYINKDKPEIAVNWQVNDCYDDIEKRLGYRFTLNSGTYPSAVGFTQNLDVSLNLQNLGFAAPFNARTAYLVLQKGTDTYRLPLTSDPRTWLGPNAITINESLALPAGMTEGNYHLYLSLPDASATLENRAEYAIRFANQNMWIPASGLNDLNHEVYVSATMSTPLVTNSGTKVYPVPANESLTVELVTGYEAQPVLYNFMGQKLSVPYTTNGNALQLNTQSLPDGTYILNLGANDTSGRKIIIKH